MTEAPAPPPHGPSAHSIAWQLVRILLLGVAIGVAMFGIYIGVAVFGV